MKKVYFCIFDGDDPNNFLTGWNSNSLYKIEDNKVYFCSKFGKKTEVNFYYIVPKLNEEFINQVSKFINPAIQDAGKISDEPILYDELIIDKIKAIITSKVNKYYYENLNHKISIFDFITNIFISCLMNRVFQNGNKRFSLCFLILILESFGYYFKWSKGLWKNYKVHELQIAEFVEKMKNNQIEKHFDEIKLWIKYNIVISIPRM